MSHSANEHELAAAAIRYCLETDVREDVGHVVAAFRARAARAVLDALETKHSGLSEYVYAAEHLAATSTAVALCDNLAVNRSTRQTLVDEHDAALQAWRAVPEPVGADAAGGVQSIARQYAELCEIVADADRSIASVGR